LASYDILDREHILMGLDGFSEAWRSVHSVDIKEYTAMNWIGIL